MLLPVTPPAWWKSRPGCKPLIILLGVVIMLFMVVCSIPQSLITLVGEKNLPGYKLSPGCSTIVESVNHRFQSSTVQGEKKNLPLGPKKVARLSMVMIGILAVAVLFWATEAVSMGGTDLLVAVLMYLFCILPPNDIAKAYLKDAVFFILGVLSVAVGISKTGLDRRVGFILLSKIRSMGSLCFLFFPGVALCAGFVPGHALVALMIPVLMGVYKASCKAHGVLQDRSLAVLLLIGLAYAGNIGAMVSPLGGGGNPLMMGYLSDLGVTVTFTAWMIQGGPFALVLSLVLGLYLYLVVRPKSRVTRINPALVVEKELAGLPGFGGREAIMALIFVLMILLMVVPGNCYGLGGPALGAVFAMIFLRILTWKEFQNEVALDVVGLYGAACAMSAGLYFTGGALWVARSVVSALSGFMVQGDWLFMGVGVITGILTNFMGDGVVVAALGPIVLPMATPGQVNPLTMGLGCAFASSFAHCLVFGSPNNAICFGMGRDPETGERLLKVIDFLKYGVPFWVICLGALHVWAWIGSIT